MSAKPAHMDDDGLIYRCLLCAEDASQPDGRILMWWRFAPLKHSLTKMICHAIDYHHVPADAMRRSVRRPGPVNSTLTGSCQTVDAFAVVNRSQRDCGEEFTTGKRLVPIIGACTVSFAQ